MTTATFAYDDQKFKELLLYIAEESVGDPKYGKTKLNKILFYVDFMAYGVLGRPVTGAEYQRRPYGPVPRQIIQARQALIASGEAQVQRTERFGFEQERFVSKRPPNLSIFSQDELNLINEVLKALRNKSAVETSELSHREPGWKIAGDRESIPYSAVFLNDCLMTADDVRRGQEVFQILQGNTD